MEAVDSLRARVPMPIRTLVRKYIPRRDTVPASWRYQTVSCDLYPRLMHEGDFARLHEAYSSEDPLLSFDANVTRMRNYMVCSLARLAVNNTDGPVGSFATAGIAFGTAPLTLQKLLFGEFETFYFVDPFDGRGRNDYNDDVEFVAAKLSPESKVSMVVGVIPDCLFEPPLNGIGDRKVFTFVHLNTNDIDAEIASMDWFNERLLPGGILVWDTYGWRGAEKQKEIDSLLMSLGLNFFVLPTGQLVVSKPLRSRRGPSVP